MAFCFHDKTYESGIWGDFPPTPWVFTVVLRWLFMKIHTRTGGGLRRATWPRSHRSCHSHRRKGAGGGGGLPLQRAEAGLFEAPLSLWLYTVQAEAIIAGGASILEAGDEA